MSKYRIAWLPGDGIGIEVMDAAAHRARCAGVRRRVRPRRHRLGLLVRRGRCLPPAHDRPAEERRRRDVRRDHLEAGQGRRGRARARPAGQGPRLPLADRAHAAALRPLRLPAPLQGVPGQPAQLQGRHRPRRLPREHRGPLRRRRVPPGAAGAGGHARQAGQAVRALREARGGRVRGLLQDQHAGTARSGSCAPPSSSRRRTAARR